MSVLKAVRPPAPPPPAPPPPPPKPIPPPPGSKKPVPPGPRRKPPQIGSAGVKTCVGRGLAFYISVGTPSNVDPQDFILHVQTICLNNPNTAWRLGP